MSSVHAVGDVAGFLLGRWAIEREIVDTDVVGIFRGAAEFSIDRGSYRLVDWVEAGELQWAGQTHQAGRRLRLAVRPDASGVADVAFDDGRFFHCVDLSSGRDTFIHGCAPDTYVGSWIVESSDRFRLTWDVDGPAKRITIVSTYHRAE